jgi:hypothetical protein
VHKCELVTINSRVRRYIDSRRQKRFEPFMTYLADMELNFKRLSYEVTLRKAKAKKLDNKGKFESLLRRKDGLDRNHNYE